MKYKIVYDKPGRLRIRAGSFAFEKEQEGAVVSFLLSEPSISSAKAHFENGSILVIYKGSRETVLEKIRSITKETLLTSAVTAVSAGSADSLKSELLTMVAKRICHKLLFPVFLSRILIVIRALKFIRLGLRSLAKGKLTVEVLDAASITASLLQGNYQTAGTIMFLLNLSSLLEDYTRAKTKEALTESLALKTEKVWLETEGTEVLVPIDEVNKGDIVKVQTGSLIPCDGEVVRGAATVNESSMTGEPLPQNKAEGSTVFAGTVIENGCISIRVRNISQDTKISHIIDLIDNSANLKAEIQSKAERLADGIVPFSFATFFATLLLTRNVTRAVSVLMVDYSCAVKLSTPIAVISAIREASVHNITVKGGKFLEAIADADTLVFDKTGTLTNAQPVLTKILSFNGKSEDEILRIAACIEEHFPHSMANAIVNASADKGLIHNEMHTKVEYIVAHGIATEINGKRTVIGSYHFVCEDENVVITEEQKKKISRECGSDSVIYLAIGSELEGVLCIEDPPREDAAETIAGLKKAGINNIVMLTGDSKKAAASISERLGITEYHAGVLPEQKHEFVRKLKESGKKVIMVGDGINDAPALAEADVSVAMSDASDIAKETADITLCEASLSELITLRKLSTKLIDRISTNYSYIVAINSSLILLGAAGLISPSLSALLHNSSTMLISAKSMTPLLKKKNKK